MMRIKIRSILLCSILVILSFCSLSVAASVAVSGESALVMNQHSFTYDDLGEPVKYLMIVTSLSFIPALVIASTSFTRIIIVLSMLRSALGLQSSPPNAVMVLLALFLTIFSMSSVIDEIHGKAILPYLNNSIGLEEAVGFGATELKTFMLSNTDEEVYISLIDATKGTAPNELSDISYMHLVPAFMLTEIKTAFQMGFLIYIPFILIDLIVASILMGLGMIMVPPMTISMPIKILVFVLADGWSLLSNSLILSVSV
ncbi:flagellar type III secretion system pore protein FliP [Vibrio vulnificus]|nr:flagellar type III secretion system pore protein FliP [Vibrio vulnificus]